VGRDDQSGRDERLEVIEFGGPRRDGTPGPPWPGWLPKWLPRWLARWLPIVLAAAVAVAALVYVRKGKSPSATPTHAPTATAAGASPSTGRASPVATPPAVRVTDLGRALLRVSGGWELFGRGPTEVVRVELARGRIAQTAVPALTSGGAVSFVAGEDWAMVRPLDHVLGYVVPDGQAVRLLSGELNRSGPALPGPDPATVWVPTGDPDQPKMILVDVLGRPTGPSIAIPDGIYNYARPDGTGDLLLSGPGGVYSARPDGLRRVTTGTLMALGPTRWLTFECDDRYRCATVVINRGTGSRHVLHTQTRQAGGPHGAISANGAFAALLQTDTSNTTRVHLLDLASGVDRQLDLPVDRSYEDSNLAWSPDSRWLLVIAAGGKLSPVDPATGQVHDLGVALPALSQLAPGRACTPSRGACSVAPGPRSCGRTGRCAPPGTRSLMPASDGLWASPG